jgi:glyoxylase-like metal-dependent hydrolase (beta-lactamase superfamily II)
VHALRRATDGAGVQVVEQHVAAIEVDGGRVVGVRLGSGERLDAANTVLCAGTWSGRIGGLPAEAVPPVRPVKGQVVVLRQAATAEVPGATVRAIVHGRSVYLVPRPDGRLVLGATQEERGFDTTVTAGGVRQLLDDAASVLPVVEAKQAEIVRSDFAIGDHTRILPTPGHTPGHVAFTFGRGKDDAVFSGDLMHSPLQTRYPELSVKFDVDQAHAAKTRRAFLERYVEEGGPTQTLADRGGLCAQEWALGWHRVWIVEWYLAQAALWIADEPDDHMYARVVRTHIEEAVRLLNV